MDRLDIIHKIGDKYRVGNTETGEFSYAQALKSVGKDIKDYQKGTSGPQHAFLDIRFENDRLAVLVECKTKFNKWDKAKIQRQLQDYVRFEKAFSDKKIVAILAETDGDGIWVWHGQSVIIDDEHKSDEMTLRAFEEYENLCFGKVNDKIKIVDSIKALNEKLHSDGMNEKLRSQFVGACLLALKNGLVYKDIKETISPETGKKLTPEKVIIKNIKDILEGLLTRSGSPNKAGKLAILNNKVLGDQDVASLTYKELEDILAFIDINVVPYINDKSIAGQDLLNLFFTTFNKYVGKSDKNQAFTPDHICDFMSKAIGVNKNSRVLDPCCGSGAFLVRAMTDAMDDCDTEAEREAVKKNQIFGIEYEEGAFGLSSTNMLIHGDGNSNVVQDSMFHRGQWIADHNINIVLMNPPYNATKKCCDPDYTKSWDSRKKEDPSKGLHYVEWIARHVPSTCKMAVLLPMQAAIGNSGDIKKFKKKMLDRYTLDAVFSLPTEMFYPGASAIACCMIFDLSQKHERAGRDTFFGYFKDDRFVKRKGLGRIELTDSDGNSLWGTTKELWLNLYRNKREVPGLSVMHKVTWEDEWLAEAYMQTDYSTLTGDIFQKALNDYVSYLVKEGEVGEKSMNLDKSNWRSFSFGRLIEEIYKAKAHAKIELTVSASKKDGFLPFVSRTEANNGVDCYVLSSDAQSIEPGNAIVIGDTTSTISYQPKPFVTGDHIIVIRAQWLNAYTGIFLIGLLQRERFRYSYGRAFLMDSIERTTLSLPVKRGGNGAVIDETRTFSDEGYVPDWEWMETYVKSLQYGDRIV